jgi:hypothetical protein
MQITCYLFHVSPFLGLFFDPEVGSEISSETSGEFQIIKQKFISKDRTLHKHLSDNLRCYKIRLKRHLPLRHVDRN